MSHPFLYVSVSTAGHWPRPWEALIPRPPHSWASHTWSNWRTCCWAVGVTLGALSSRGAGHSCFWSFIQRMTSQCTKIIATKTHGNKGTQ